MMFPSNTISRSAPIGIFDSGIGGLTVFRRIRELLPHENLVYLGDTARVPYGSRSPQVIQNYASKCTQFFMKGQGVKLVVVACNTSSAHALEAVRSTVGVRVIGVIEPGAELAAKTSKTGRIGVIGTPSTIVSDAYGRALHRSRPGLEVFNKACPLFVPLAEEGYTDHQVAQIMTEIYLRELRDRDIDTLILGCTHYPLLLNVIGSYMGEKVALIDSASAVASEVRLVLEREKLELDGARPGDTKFFATDIGENIARLSATFLGRPVNVEHVDIA